MKTFTELERKVRELDSLDNVKVFGAYRESAFSDIRYLQLIVSGNCLTCTDESISAFDQYKLNNVSELRNYLLIRKASGLTYNELYVSVRLNNSTQTGFKVKDFIEENDNLILDLAF